MDYRVGLCSACGASFKVPASFSAEKAKCKVCGGVVQIGPVRSDAPPARPAAPPMPSRKLPAREPEPAARERPKREGPSMKERLLAERRAAEQAAEQAAARASGRPAAQAASPKPAPKPAPKAAPKPSPAAAGVGGRAGAAEAKEPGPRTRGSRRGAAGARGRRGAQGEEGDQGGKAERGHGRARKKQSPALLITAVGLVVVAGAAGGWFVFFGGGLDGTPPSPEGRGAAQAAAPGAAVPASEPGPQKPADQPGAEGLAEADEPFSGQADEPTPGEAPRAARPQAQRDPASVDLAGLEEFGPDRGVDDIEWRRIRDLVATALDSESGISGSRARRELEEMTRKAVPALINAMRHLDFGIEQGYRDGDVAQRILQNIANGRNFGWYYSTEPNDHYRNKVVVRNWHGVWARARTDEAYWKEFAKLTDDQPGADSAGAPGAGGRSRLDEDDLDALDDI